MKISKYYFLCILLISTNIFSDENTFPLSENEIGKWEILDKTADQTESSLFLYSKVEGEDNPNGIINFWTKTIFNQNNPLTEKGGGLVSSMLINCKTKQYAHEESILYNPEGKLIKVFNYTKNNSLEWSRVSPKSNSNEILNRYCPNKF